MGWTRHAYMLPVLAVMVGAMDGCGDDAGDAAPGTILGEGTDAGDPTNGDGSAPEGGSVRRASPLPSHGASVAVSPDDTRLVAANRASGTVSIFAIDWTGTRPALTKLAELAVGGEVSQVVMHPSGDFALALSRLDQKLVRIDGLRGVPSVGSVVKTGSEPTGLALTPFGDTAWVANWVDGTVLAVDVATMTVKRTVDLNVALAASGRVGTVKGRPALAHPRSVAITNNGNAVDDDERVYVTDFYAHQKVAVLADGSNADVAKAAVVYSISIKDPADVKLIELPPMTDMGFKDHKNGTTGCFPNQLLSMNIQGSFGYVLSICASPKGPIGPFTGPAAAACADDTQCPGAVPGSCVATKCTTNCAADATCGANGGKCIANVCAANTANVKTTLAPVVSIIDLGASKTIATVNLAKEFSTYFDGLAMPDDGSRRFPLTTTDIGFVPGTVTGYVVSKGSDALFRVDFNATYEATSIDAVGHAKAPFIPLAPAGIDSSLLGRSPSGIAVAFKLHADQRFAFVNNEITRNVSVVDLQAQDLADRTEGTPVVASSSAPPTDAAALARLEGERLFSTGLGRWSLKGQAWASCESCHIDGLSDNVTWHFPRGPRQPNSLDGLFDSKDPTNSRVHNWTGIQDEVSDHEMGAIRGTMGGIGAIVKDVSLNAASRIAIDKNAQAGLAGSSTTAADIANPAALSEACVVDDWASVTMFFKSIRSPRRPSNLVATEVEAGRALFQAGNCQGCHGGSKWTTSRVFYTPDATNAVNGALKSKSWTTTVASAGFPPALLPAATAGAQNMRYNGAAGADFDQLVCVLRPVGTFGVAESAVGVAELRRDMVAKGQGDEPDGRGFNPPSLLSASVGAPYFHAGQVRTLEGLLESPFDAHREALKTGFLAAGSPNREANVAALVAFLLSIDEDAQPIAEPALGSTGGSFCTK
jgi:mono/diheme cytochrome c family protein